MPVWRRTLKFLLLYSGLITAVLIIVHTVGDRAYLRNFAPASNTSDGLSGHLRKWISFLENSLTVSNNSLQTTEKRSHTVPNSNSKDGVATANNSRALFSSPSRRQQGQELTMSNGTQKLLCLELNARLGNNLFQYASLLGLALTMNRKPVVYRANLLSQHIKMPASIIPNNEEMQRCAKSVRFFEASCCKYYETLTKMDPRYDYTTGFYLQSWRYWKDHEDTVKKAIEFTEPVNNRAATIVKMLREIYKNRVLVGVHIRRGDLVTPRFRQMGYPLTPPEYIHRALTYYTNLFPNATFVVASDSIHWCKKNFPVEFSTFFLSPVDAGVDLKVLASLDHTVISFGTYSWWAAYLNGGQTVYMKDFRINGTFIASQFHPDGRDYFYPGWVPL